MANSPTHSISGVASPATAHGCDDLKAVEATNVAAAIRHPGLLTLSQGKWQVLAEEPFREPPYWLFESNE